MNEFDRADSLATLAELERELRNPPNDYPYIRAYNKYTGGVASDLRREPSFLLLDILRARETPPLGEDPIFWDETSKKWFYFTDIGDNPGLKSAIENEVARLLGRP